MRRSSPAMAHFREIGADILFVEAPTDLDQPSRIPAELEEIVGRFLADRPVAENLALFERRGLTVGPIRDIPDLMEHPFIQGRKVIETYGDPEICELPVHAPFPRLSETPANVRGPAPALGEHTNDILADIGLSSDGIAALRDSGVI